MSSKTERYAWVDHSACLRVPVLTFDEITSSHGRFVTTAWIPWDSAVNADVYRIVITQLKFVKMVINNSSFTIRCSREGANAIHISSNVLLEIQAASDMMTELVNFRVRDAVPHNPTTEYVNLLMIKSYGGSNFIGSKDAITNKNFVVALSDCYNTKSLVSYLDADTLRVALLGRPADTALVKTAFQSLVRAVADGKQEDVEQSMILASALSSNPSTSSLELETPADPELQQNPYNPYAHMTPAYIQDHQFALNFCNSFVQAWMMSRHGHHNM